MNDRREEILFRESSNRIDEIGLPVGDALGDSLVFKSCAISAMDEYFTERALELLEYMARNTVCCVAFKEDDGSVSNRFYYKGEHLTAEQLFENFL